MRARRGRHGCRRLRHEQRHARCLHARDAAQALRARRHLRRRAGHPARPVGRRRAGEHGRAVHHRAVLPAVVAGEGPDRQQASVSGSSRRTATTHGRRTSCCSSPTRRRTSSPTATTWRSSGCRWSRSRTATRPSRRWRPPSSSRQGSLVASMARYNEYAALGEDPDFHKHPDWLAPQTTGPVGRLRPHPRHRDLRRLHARRRADRARRRGAARGPVGDPRPVRRRRLRVQHRAGRQRATAPAPSWEKGRSSARRAGSAAGRDFTGRPVNRAEVEPHGRRDFGQPEITGVSAERLAAAPSARTCRPST